MSVYTTKITDWQHASTALADSWRLTALTGRSDGLGLELGWARAGSAVGWLFVPRRGIIDGWGARGKKVLTVISWKSGKTVMFQEKLVQVCVLPVFWFIFLLAVPVDRTSLGHAPKQFLRAFPSLSYAWGLIRGKEKGIYWGVVPKGGPVDGSDWYRIKPKILIETCT